MSITVVGWLSGDEDAEERRFQTDDWQLAGANVAYLLRDGFKLIIVDDLSQAGSPI